MESRTKFALGWAAILIISLFPVFLLFHFGGAGDRLNSYASATHTLGEIFGLVGMTMFAITFILSTRIRWIEDVFGGLDKVYLTHGILGGTALIMILMHPIFLVLKFVPLNLAKAATYLLPSNYWSVNFGIIALLGMVSLIFITLYTKMKYHQWKFTHEFLGLMFIFAVFHIFLVRGQASQDGIFAGYYVYAAAVSAVGLFGFSYSLFIKNRLFKNAVYSISSVKRKDDIFEITIAPEHKPISYKAGQFLFLRFYNEKISDESHPFSIASPSNDREILIVAKTLGDYTKKLAHLKKGDKVSVEGPYGRFSYGEHLDRDQVWIAAGIGITPFIGMVQDAVDDKKLKGKITLFYSARKQQDMVGDKLFRELSKESQKFTYVPRVSSIEGRIDEKLLKEKAGNLAEKEFFLCGAGRFKEAITGILIKNNVDKWSIHEEAFDFR